MAEDWYEQDHGVYADPAAEIGNRANVVSGIIQKAIEGHHHRQVKLVQVLDVLCEIVQPGAQ
jgi:hypothetical protein